MDSDRSFCRLCITQLLSEEGGDTDKHLFGRQNMELGNIGFTIIVINMKVIVTLTSMCMGYVPHSTPL